MNNKAVLQNNKAITKFYSRIVVSKLNLEKKIEL